MKKYLIQFSLAVLLFSAAPMAQAANTPVSTTPIHNTSTPNVPEQSKEALILLHRLETIQAMDISNMTRAEKRVVGKEVKSIEKQMKALNSGGGVYVSVGALIIIVLLIIIFL